MFSAERAVTLLTRGTNPSLSRFSYVGDTIWCIDKRQNIGKTRDSLSPYQEVWRESGFLLNGQPSLSCLWLRAKSPNHHLALNRISPLKDEARNVQLLICPYSLASHRVPLEDQRSHLTKTMRNFNCVAVHHSPQRIPKLGSCFLPTTSQNIPWNSLRIQSNRNTPFLPEAVCCLK